MAKHSKQYNGSTQTEQEQIEQTPTEQTTEQAPTALAAPSGTEVDLDTLKIVGRGRGRSAAVKFIETQLPRIAKGKAYHYGDKFPNSKGELEPIQPSHRQVLMSLYKDGFEFATRTYGGVSGLVVKRLLTDEEIAEKVSARIAAKGNMNGAPHAAN